MLRGKFLLPLAVASFISGGSALAQNPGPVGPPSAAPDPQFVQNAIAVLQQQRNAANDQVAQTQAQLAVTQGKLDAALKELADLKAADKAKDEPKVTK
jgi:hypothetical protein